MLPERWEAVLFLHHGLGDLVMAMPMLSELRRVSANPRRILVFVKCPNTRRLLEATGFTDSFTVRIFNRRAALLYPLVLGVRRPKVFLAPQSCGDWRMPLLARLTLAGYSLGPATEMAGPQFTRTIPGHDHLREHKVEYYLRFLGLAGYPEAVARTWEPVRLAADLRQRAGNVLAEMAPSATEWFGFTPGSTPREKHKRWPSAHYAALADRLIRRRPGAHIAIIGSRDELPLLEEIRRAASEPERVHVVAPDDIGLALGIYAHCACVITGCNGPSHLAGMVGTPLVSIYGPTNPGNTGAWATARRVLRAGLACAPCYRLDFLAGCGTPLCMSLVTPAEVDAAVEDLLRRGGCDPLPWCDNPGATGPDPAAYERQARLVTELPGSASG